MWLLLVFCGVLTIHLVFQVYKTQSHWKTKGIPFIKPWFFLGNVAASFFQARPLIDKIQDFYRAFPNKRYVGFYQFLKPVLLIRDLELIKTITIKEFDTFPDHGFFDNTESDPVVNRNLFTLTAQDGWHNVRTKISPTFTRLKMTAMFPLMDRCAKQFVDHFRQEGSGCNGIEMKDAFARFTNDIIATTAFGISVDSLSNPQNEFFLMTKDLNNFEGIRAFKFFGYYISPALMKTFKISSFSQAACETLKGIIKDTLKVREEQNVVRPDMIHLLLQAKKSVREEDSDGLPKSATAVIQNNKFIEAQRKKLFNITDDDIMGAALSFVFAGFDATSTLMCYVAYELALNTIIQRKLIEEIDLALKECDGKLTYEIMMGMRYLDKVILETLRKWPPEMVTDRKSRKPFVIDADEPGEQLLYLESGTVCWIPIFAIHGDPKYYPDPENFDPERFSEEHKHKIKPCSFLPFGSGPRNCVGSRFALLETKLIILRILQKFEIVPVRRTQIPIVFNKRSLTIVPEGGFWLGLKPRQYCCRTY